MLSVAAATQYEMHKIHKQSVTDRHAHPQSGVAVLVKRIEEVRMVLLASDDERTLMAGCAAPLLKVVDVFNKFEHLCKQPSAQTTHAL